MARIFDFLRKAAPEEDIREPRRAVARFLAGVCDNDLGWRVKGQSTGVPGPLGGEFELLIVEVPTEFGPRKVRICVYGMGVFVGD